MATYKVIQDVEAEDKLIGPLSPRQFLYAGICAISLYLMYFTSTKGAGFLAVILLPIAGITGFFAFPWGRDQPTEIWALAKIRFLIKPRRRIWDQGGVKELVTITAPKRVQTAYTNGLTETEVQSRLRALADTIDSRGWAIKNSNLNLTMQTPLTMAEPSSDRLVAPSSLPQGTQNNEVLASDDILDEKNNATAGRVDTLINAASSAHRKKIVESLKENQPAGATADTANRGSGKSSNNAKPNNYWFLNQPNQSASIPSDMVTFNTQVVTPSMAGDDTSPATRVSGLTPEEEEARLVAELEARKLKTATKSYYGHLHTIQPLSEQQGGAAKNPEPGPAMPRSAGQSASNWTPTSAHPQTASPGPAAPPAAANSRITDPTPDNNLTPENDTPPPVTPEQQAAILQLSTRNDLNVATIAREAQRQGPQDEVVINLH